MDTSDNNLGPSLSHAEPILAVKDVLETVFYWHAFIGFPDKWTWGDPVNHGGVSWNGVQVQFSQDPNLAAVSKGNSIFIRVKNLPVLYDFHKKENIEIVDPLENKPWGMAGYTIREINGYFIIFGGAPISGKNIGSGQLPLQIKITERKPDRREYVRLTSAVGWGRDTNDEMVDRILAAPVFSVVAENLDTGEVVGCALLLTDNARFYYVKDVMVHPEWQQKQIGSAMMKKMSDWINNNAPDNAFVVLITPENLATFYKPFGFSPAFGMVRIIQRGH